MEFERFSLFLKHTKVREFAEGLERGEVRATRCPRCGAVYYPPRAECPKCFEEGMEWITLRGPGKLVSYTAIHITPDHFTPDFSRQAPFSEYLYRPAPVGIVELAEGVRVMGWIIGVPPEELRVGMKLYPRAEVLKDGRATVVLVGKERE